MRFFILFFFCYCVALSFCSGQGNVIAHDERKAFTEAINDSTEVEVFLKYNSEGEPEYYFSHVSTPVCEHGLCRLMVIDVFWDLLGNFLKYEFPPGEALTKLDHHEFSREDHEQLYKILSDKASILRDYPAEDLVDRRSQAQTEKADAVSAATRVDVRDAVVSGAVYSTYVLWHIVNGPIAFRIMDFSKPMLTKERVEKMFYSRNFYYQYFALNAMTAADSVRYLGEVIHLVKNGISYIPYFAIEKVPISAWATDSCQQSLLGFFRSADFELQNAMLAGIGNVQVSPVALEILISGMHGLKENQILKVLDIIRKNETRLTDQARSGLAKLASHANQEISKEIRLILKCG